MESDGPSERDDEGFADCDSPDDETMDTNLAAEGEGCYSLLLLVSLLLYLIKCAPG